MIIPLMLAACLAQGQESLAGSATRELTPAEYSVVADTLHDAWTFWQVDANDPSIYTTKYVWANRESVELLGIDRVEARGKSFADTIVDAEGEGGRRWVTMYADAIRTNRPVRIQKAPYDGKVYQVTILPVAEDLIVVLFQVVGVSSNRNLEISDDDWLRIQMKALSALQHKAEEKLEDIEETAEEHDSAVQDILYGPIEDPEPTSKFEASPLP